MLFWSSINIPSLSAADDSRSMSLSMFSLQAGLAQGPSWLRTPADLQRSRRAGQCSMRRTMRP